MPNRWMVCIVLGLSLIAWTVCIEAADQTQSKAKEVIPTVDFDKDGKISLAEHLAWEKSLFIANDLDGDGYITPLEVAEIQMKRLLKMQEAGELVLTAEELSKLALLQYAFSPSLDTNQDGKVSLEEHLAWETQHYKSRDLNGDGYITMDELIPQNKAQLSQHDKDLKVSESKNFQQSSDSGQANLPREGYQDK